MNYRNLQLTDLHDVVHLWNQNVQIYKPFTDDLFTSHVLKHPDFNYDGAFVAIDQDKIVGLAIGVIRKIEKNDDSKPGYLTTLLVDEKYRGQGIAQQLLILVEQFVKQNGKNKINFSYRSTLNFPWYIPKTNLHDHPGAPGVIVNSDLYLFLINHGYLVKDHADAFHQDLEKFTMPEHVMAKINRNRLNGYQIELYDSQVHFGIEDFYRDINDEGFERVIRSNLELAKPLPFLVISHKGQILGWTGAMYTEPSGRAHFDGIAIGTGIRGLGLGQGLWCSLADYSKKHGSKFMTFFTGRYNHARYIYLKSGFNIIQSFAIMEKEI